MPETTPPGETAALWRVILALALFQGGLHLASTAAARDPHMLAPHLVAWVHDVALFTATAAVFAVLARRAAGAARGKTLIAARGAVIAEGLVAALYPPMLQTFLATPVNILLADGGSASVFVRDYAGFRMLWPAAAALGVGLMAPRWTCLRLPPRQRLVGGVLAVVTIITLAPGSPNPMVYSLRDSVAQLFVHRVVPHIVPVAAPRDGSGAAFHDGTSATPCDVASATPRDVASATPRDVASATPRDVASATPRDVASATPRDVASATPRPGSVAAPRVDWSGVNRAPYRHVLIIVMESVTATEFENELLPRTDGFFARHRDHTRYFSAYHATNLDSYPSLIAMMTSLQVPFRAYADPDRYVAVNDEPNLARGLRAAGYRTVFASTYEEQPFVPTARDWDEIIDRRAIGDVSGWLSLGENRMESATEDRAALPAIVTSMASAPRSLVLVELVFGHSPAWRAASGKTPLEYGNEYLNDLWERLTRAGLAEQTLVVVVSDHGVRTAASSPDNYHVPLVVMGHTVRPGREDRFVSHLDLQTIVAHYLVGTPMPPPRQRVVVVGSTERWIYGEIRNDGRHVFIDDTTGSVTAGTLDPAALYRDFQERVSAFLATW